MKKFICTVLSLILVFAFALPAMAAEGTVNTYRLGVAMSDLSDPVQAAQSDEIVSYARDAYSAQTAVSDAKGSSQTQLEQVESFIETSVNAIILDAVDPSSLENTVAKAREAGIMVLAYGDAPAGCNTYYRTDDYNAGIECGRMAGLFINEVLGGNCEVGLLDVTQNLSERADGIAGGLALAAPNAKITSSQSINDASSAYDDVKSMTTEHPNIQVMVCVDEQGAVAANKYVSDAKINADTFGVFCVGATKELVSAIDKGRSVKGCVSLGMASESAKIVVDATMNMLGGLAYQDVYYTPATPVDESNCTYYMSAAGW